MQAAVIEASEEEDDHDSDSDSQVFDLACTDLNEDELDLNASARKMSIRALNVSTKMNRCNFNTAASPY